MNKDYLDIKIEYIGPIEKNVGSWEPTYFTPYVSQPGTIERIIAGEKITIGDLPECCRKKYPFEPLTNPIGTHGAFDIQFNGTDATFFYIFVPEKYRRKGILEAMKRKAVEIAKERGILHLWANVHSSNKPMHEAMKKYNFNEASKCNDGLISYRVKISDIKI